MSLSDFLYSLLLTVFSLSLLLFFVFACVLDNATDPGVCAKQIWIDVLQENCHICLSFTDNGCGMTPNKLHKMLR